MDEVGPQEFRGATQWFLTYSLLPTKHLLPLWSAWLIIFLQGTWQSFSSLGVSRWLFIVRQVLLTRAGFFVLVFFAASLWRCPQQNASPYFSPFSLSWEILTLKTKRLSSMTCLWCFNNPLTRIIDIPSATCVVPLLQKANYTSWTWFL